MKEDTLRGLQRYHTHGLPTGDFLYAVLTNNLKESFARADEENQRDMFEIVSYCYNHLDMRSWGSKEAVGAWIAHGGLEGIHKSQEAGTCLASQMGG